MIVAVSRNTGTEDFILFKFKLILVFLVNKKWSALQTVTKKIFLVHTQVHKYYSSTVRDNYSYFSYALQHRLTYTRFYNYKTWEALFLHWCYNYPSWSIYLVNFYHLKIQRTVKQLCNEIINKQTNCIDS